MVLAMLVLPQAIVIGWSAMERDIGGTLQASAKQTAEESAVVLREAHAGGIDAPRTLASLSDIATAHTARIRVVRLDGSARLDVDEDQGTDLIHQVGTLFFGPDGAPTLRQYDETLGPLASRPEIAALGASAPGAGDVATGCRTSPADKLLVCHAARATDADAGGEIIYVQESSRRAVRVLYDLRYHLLRLSLLMLPLALAFSWWMGRRMAHPIEWLRERVLEKARSANPRADLDAPPGDEVADLAEAFNGLLGSLDDRRRANEAFVADLVHEFKNPVAAIRTCAETLDSGGVDEKRAARISKILADSSTRLDALVSQFLELARAEAGMPNEVRGRVDLAALTRGVTAGIEEGHPDVKFTVDAAGPACVLGVEPRLDSLVRNLVDNAASFAGGGGEISVSLKPDPEDSGLVVLEVSDSGPGIPERDLPRMFERFFTTRAVESGGSEPSPRRQKGTGLGLALVKAVAEAHGGSVSVHSSPGTGATFRVVLPVD